MPPKISDGLTPKQRRFCELYARSEEFFCNGVKAYMAAFGSKGKPVSYDSAKVGASKLLADVRVSKYINEILEADGLNTTFVDKQLTMLMIQNADLHVKLAAIREYNRLKGRITKEPEVKEAVTRQHVWLGTPAFHPFSRNASQWLWQLSDDGKSMTKINADLCEPCLAALRDIKSLGETVTVTDRWANLRSASKPSTTQTPA